MKDFARTLKSNIDPKNTLKLKILNQDNKEVGTLRLIDSSRGEDPVLVSNLTRWRNSAKRFFLSQFVATEERTLRWLKNTVLEAEDRLLFEILDDTGRSIGHAGVCKLKEDSAELDNFVRGEPGGDPSLFISAEMAMLRWLFFVLRIETITLHVFSNNWIPIRNHSSLGFVIKEKHSLSYIEKDGTLQHLVNSTAGQPVKYSYLTMCLSKKAFEEIFSQ